MSKTDIAGIIGKSNFEKLKKHFGGNLVWIPKSGNPGTRNPDYFEKRNNLIRYFKQKGLTVKQLARKFSISEKRVYSVINSGRNL